MTFGGLFLVIAGLAGVIYAIVVLDRMAVVYAMVVPMVIGHLLFSAGRKILHIPQSLTLDETGITFVDRSGIPQSHPWTQFAWVERRYEQYTTIDFLYFCDASGASRFKLPAAILQLPNLPAVLSHYITVQSPPPPPKTAIDLKHRRYGRWATIGGIFALLLGSFQIGLPTYLYLRAGQLARHGVPGQAIVTERYLAPNGTTTRISIKIKGDSGKEGTGDFAIDPDAWDTLAVGDTFPVLYVPHNPGNNKPISSGIDLGNGPDPKQLIAMGVVALCLGFYFLVSGIKALRTPPADPTSPPSASPQNSSINIQI